MSCSWTITKLMRDGFVRFWNAVRNPGSRESGADALQFCKQTHPDLVIMDIGLPGMNGIEATAEILRQCPQTRVLIVSTYDDENAVLSAIRSGARGFVLTRASAGDLLDALRTLALEAPTSARKSPLGCSTAFRVASCSSGPVWHPRKSSRRASSRSCA
jgi:DNA-binding NarL/FixJ family response regulator